MMAEAEKKDQKGLLSQCGTDFMACALVHRRGPATQSGTGRGTGILPVSLGHTATRPAGRRLEGRPTSLLNTEF